MGVTLSNRQQFQLERINEYISGSLSRKDCALLLNLSERTVTRLSTAIRSEGISAILHGNTAKVPVNKSNQDLKRSAAKLAADVMCNKII